MLEGIIEYLKDVLFPVFCVECGEEGEWWCGKCRDKIKEIGVFRCPVCSVATEKGETCKKCSAVSSLDGVTALFNYVEGNYLSKLIHLFKYQYAHDVNRAWQSIIQERLGDDFIPLASITIIPVPLYSRRERERGFNQANIIAQILHDKYAVALLDAINLARSRYTLQQAKLNREERLKNLDNAFVWRGNAKAPINALLVDDVFTTGSTMQECAKILKQNGTEKVWGFALARG